MRQRPESFTIDNSHSLAKHLVLAGLGLCPGTLLYMDSSVNKNHGTLTNMDPSTDWVWDSMLNRFVLDFDYSNDYVALSKAAITNDFTLSCWSNWRVSGLGYGDTCTILGTTDVEISRNGFGLRYLNNSTNVTVMFADYSGIKWSYYAGYIWWGLHHIAFTRSGSSFHLWLDGVDQGEQTSAATFSWTLNLRLGARTVAKYRLPFFGQLSDVMLHNRVLSISEIQQLADRSNVMLSGLIKPPKRKLYSVRSTAYSQRFFSLQTSFGAFALQS